MNLTNKQKAQIYHTAVSNYDLAKIEAMVDKDYIQHNPRVPTGRAAFLALIPNLQKHNSKIKNMRIFQDGSHVIMHHLWQNAIPFGAPEKAAFHIIRFDQAGLIAEHWSVMSDLAAANLSGRTLLDGPTEILDLIKTDQNKAKVTELFRLLISGSSENRLQILRKFFLPEFHQHHPDLKDGVESFCEFVGARIKFKKQHQVFGSGNLVLSISEGFIGETPMAFYDLFRLDLGMIAEHWSVHQDIPTTGLANDNTMFDF